MLLNASERDPIKVADWIELQVLYSPSKSFSLESVRSRIDAEGSLAETSPDDEEDSSEQLIAIAQEEMERRRTIVGAAYPFEISDGVAKATVTAKYVPYVFSLLVADREYYSPDDNDSKIFFEHLVTLAVKKYFDCESLRFGAPRDTMPPGIVDAINKLSEKTGIKIVRGYDVNCTDRDLGLDVAAWKTHTDLRPNMLLLYLQCATGIHWTTKKSDCNLAEWRGLLYWQVDPIRGLAVPYVLSEDEWARETVGLLFLDRLRIAACLQGFGPRDCEIDWWKWCKSRIREGRARNRS